MASSAPLSAVVLLLVFLAVAALAADDVNKTLSGSKKTKDLNNKVDIKLYTRHNTAKGQKLDPYNATFLENSNFDPMVPTKILVHGWLSGESKAKGGAIVKDTLLEISNYNVILVDWSEADSINYVGSRLLVSTLGELIGDLIDQLYKSGGIEYSDLHLIGHSLGAHAMGFAGRTVGLGTQGRITALDPAGPLFWNDPAVRLDKSDAGFVDVIHTCAPLLGYRAPIGHVDFYPNGGTWVQPGCGLDAAETSRYHKKLAKFYFYNKNNAARTKGTLVSCTLDKQKILDNGFNPDFPTKVLIHGFLNGVSSLAMQLPKNAYFKANESVNVIVLDWEDQLPVYPLWFSNVKGVATRLAELIDFMAENELLKPEELHITGHSLGAHVAGIAGEHVTSGRIGRITGLDPARPLFNMEKLDGRLSKDDAELVDIVHTNAGSLGEASAIGHIDFYPNGGKVQPGCAWDVTGSCSHGRSYQLMAESIENPKGFMGWQCEDEWDAVHQRCPVSDTYAYMGEHLKYSEEGAYYLETRGGMMGPFSMSLDA